MHDSTGFLIGFLVGVILTVCFDTWVRDKGRNECDNKLLRTEKCVQIWVPEKSIKGNTP